MDPALPRLWEKAVDLRSQLEAGCLREPAYGRAVKLAVDLELELEQMAAVTAADRPLRLCLGQLYRSPSVSPPPAGESDPLPSEPDPPPAEKVAGAITKSPDWFLS